MPSTAQNRLIPPETAFSPPTAPPTADRAANRGRLLSRLCRVPFGVAGRVGREEREAVPRHRRMTRSDAKQPTGPRRLLVNRGEAAQILGGMSVDLFDAEVRPHLREVTVGRRPLFPYADLERYVERRAVRTAGHRSAA